MALKSLQRWLAIALLAGISPWSIAAETLIEQIEALDADPQHEASKVLIQSLSYSGLKAQLDMIVDEAQADMDSAEVEREALQRHFLALDKLRHNFAQFEVFADFGTIKNQQFSSDEDECIITSTEFDNYEEYDCDASYRYAIDIWRRSELVFGILNIWKHDARDYTLNQIRESEVRWTRFSQNVTSDQFPWETILNGWLLEGTISTPPTFQFRILHPMALVSVTEENREYEEEIGLEVFGIRSYSDKYEPEFGLSLFALMKSGNAEETGYGVTFSRKNFSIGLVRQDTNARKDDTKLLLGYNLAQLFENKKNELAEKKIKALRNLDAFKQKLESFSQ